jgi:hypothetical protein
MQAHGAATQPTSGGVQGISPVAPNQSSDPAASLDMDRADARETRDVEKFRGTWGFAPATQPSGNEATAASMGVGEE